MPNVMFMVLHIRRELMNRADKKMGYVRKIKNDRRCVFISHKKEDQHIALEVGKFIMEKLNMDIYLDIFDIELQEAVSVHNDEKIVQSIQEGIDISDILLCIVSDKTRLSWWVPYEVGRADTKNKKIVSLKTKNVEDFPSFLKTKDTVENLQQFISYILKNGTYGDLFYDEKIVGKIRNGEIGGLEKYFD